jgi:hypothetical protein
MAEALVDGFSAKRTVSTRTSHACPPPGVDVSRAALRFLAGRLRKRRHALGTRWRCLRAGRQACSPSPASATAGQPYAQLAARFWDRHYPRLPIRHRSRRTPGRPRSHARRSSTGRVEEGIPDPGRDTSADRQDRRRAALLLGQTQEARHERAGHSDPNDRLLWASPALAGAVHDVRAAREHGIIDALAQAGINCWADKGYQGAGAWSVTLTAADGTVSLFHPQSELASAVTA